MNELRLLSETELDNVNGGFFFVGLIAGKLIGAAGAAVAYGVAKAID